MTESRDQWNAATWEGNRREQLRRSLKLSIEQRLRGIEDLQDISDVLASARTEGRLAELGSSGHHLSAGASQVRQESPAYAVNGQTNSIVLAGCNPIPLAGYLKAIGVFRLVAEQADPEARAAWINEQFILQSTLDKTALREFLLQRYQPTPIVAPWNGGSGFYPKDNQSGIGALEQGSAIRFAMYRETIASIRQVLAEQHLDQRPDGRAKVDLLGLLRARLPDAALDWLDAAVLLTDQNLKYPPLLGTGGNDGRLDFTNNFMQRLADLFDPESGQPTAAAEFLLPSALFGSPISGLGSAAIGQFSPGGAGGPNASTGFEGSSRVNPWDFVFMLEGAMLFAANTTRRLQSATAGALSYPFTVRPVGAGAGGTALSDEGAARAEIWLPIWSTPVSMHELSALFSEGRVTLGRRPARDGLDFVRAISKLGVDRGITAFQRYAFLMRSGKAYLATPLNRIETVRNPAADLIDELEHGSRWLERFRRLARSNHASAGIQSLVRRLEDALFDLAMTREYPALKVQRLLILLGEAQLFLARSPKSRDENAGACPPVPWLSSEWLVKAADQSDELAIAAALAGLHTEIRRDGKPIKAWPLRTYIAPDNAARQPRWDENRLIDVCWGSGALDSNLARLLQRRLLVANRIDAPDKPFGFSRTATTCAIARWLADDLDHQRIASLVPGLALIQIPYGQASSQTRDYPLPAAYRVLKPFFTTDAQLRHARLLPDERQLPMPRELPRRLAAGDVNGAVRLALRKLGVAGLLAQLPEIKASGVSGPRLLCALMVPISTAELRQLLPEKSTRERESNAAIHRLSKEPEQ